MKKIHLKEIYSYDWKVNNVLKTVLGNTCESIDPIHLVRRMKYIHFKVIVKSQFFFGSRFGKFIRFDRNRKASYGVDWQKYNSELANIKPQNER